MGSDLAWFRWYNGTRHRPKFRALTPEGRCLWIALLELSSEIGLKGVVHFTPGIKLTDEQLADEAKVPAKSIRPALEAMIQYGWVEERSECLFVTKFAERQYQSDLSAKRTKAWRERKKREGGDDVTLCDGQCDGESDGDVTPPETETDKKKKKEEEEAMWLSAWVEWYESKFVISPSGREFQDFAKLQAVGVTDDLIIAVLEDSLKEEGIDRPLLWAKRRISDMLPRGVRTKEDYEKRKAAKVAQSSTDGQPNRPFSEFD